MLLKGYWCYSLVSCPFLFSLLYQNSFTVDNSNSAAAQPGSRNEKHWWMWHWLRSCIKNFKGILIWYLMIHSASSSILQRTLVSSTNSLIVKLIISRSLIGACMSAHFKLVSCMHFSQFCNKRYAYFYCII